MKPPSFLVAGLALLCAAAIPSAIAMSVRAPNFPELVAESSAVVRAKVTAVVSRAVPTTQGEAIKTYVTFAVAKSLKGSPQQEITLAFLGGQVGNDHLEIPGMPTFEVGAEEFLFISPKPGICPLVGVMHGRYRVQTAQKAGRPYVARDNHAGLVDVHDIALPMDSHVPAAQSVARALTPEAFEQLIAAEVAHPSLPVAQP